MTADHVTLDDLAGADYEVNRLERKLIAAEAELAGIRMRVLNARRYRAELVVRYTEQAAGPLVEP